MSLKDSVPYHGNPTGVFDSDPGDTHRKVVEALAAKGTSEDRIAKATGVPLAQVRRIIEAWRRKNT